jgi:hypothetical protein
VLIEEAEKWCADSISVGSSAAVAARAHCSVEVVRAEKKEG